MTQNTLSNRRFNRDLRDDIREYWSERAETFDHDPGHKIARGAERAAWMALFHRHLGDAQGRRLLDLASGTGEIALLCHDLGYRVTGLDWAEPMLLRARAKAEAAGAVVRFLQADAERTMLPAGAQDVIVTRHLVWTLVDPVAAFAEWHRILAPGGHLLVVDGDFVSRGWIATVLSRLLGLSRGAVTDDLARRHKDILSRVYFSLGARAEAVADLLRAAGFTDVRIDHAFGAIHRAQAPAFGWKNSLMRQRAHRYAISARRTVCDAAVARP